MAGLGRTVATSSPAHTRAFFFFFDFQPGLAKMPGSGLNGDGGGESDMSIKRGQGVFQPDVDLQDGVSSFLRSPRLSD